MNRRRITVTLGAAAGGLLGAAFIPATVAFADDYSFDPIAGQPETITGLYNIYTAPPGVNETLQGYQEFNVSDSTGALGTAYGYESTAPYLTPYLPGSSDALSSSQVIYVDSDVPGGPGTAGALPDGSVVSTTWTGQYFEDIYSAIPGAGPGGTDLVTDTLKTPFGTIDLSQFINSLGFDAANVQSALPSYITGVDDPTVTAVNGLPPLTIALQGTQEFNDTEGSGGTFDGLETTTRDGFGFHTEAILVTQDLSGNAPPVGTVYNTIDFHNLSNVYSSVPGADGKDVVTDILTNTTTGKTTDLSGLFLLDDASKGLTDGTNIQPFSFDAYQISATPDSPEEFTGINGLPPGNASFQGLQAFDFTHGADTGTFNADVTTMPTLAYSNYAEALLVTSSSDPDTLPVGSVLDVSTLPSGLENIYADLPGMGTDGHNLITDTLVTSFGDYNLSWLVQGLDASAGLSPADGLVNFLDAGWLDLLHMF